MPSAPIRMLTVKEAADRLRVTPRTVWNRIQRGMITQVRSENRKGSPILIPEPAIISLCGAARWMR